MYRLAIVCCCLLLVLPASAQETPTAITAKNAAFLRMLDSVGSALPRDVAFSADGRFIVARTTDNTVVYPSGESPAEPQVFATQAYSFDADRLFVAEGRRWNLDTGLSVGVAASAHILPPDERSATTRVEIVKPGGETIVIDTGRVIRVERVAVAPDYSIVAVAAAGGYPQRVAPTVHLFRLSTGTLIAALPQPHSLPVSTMFYTPFNDSLALVVSADDPYDPSTQVTSMYDADNGALIPQFSGDARTDLVRSPAGAFAYVLYDGQLIYGTGDSVGRVQLAEWPSSRIDSLAVSVGDQGIALQEGDSVRAALFQDNGLRRPFIEVMRPTNLYSVTLAGSGLVLAARDGFTVYDLAAPDEPRRTIPLEEGVQSARLSPDFTRYTVVAAGNVRTIRDAATHAVIAELPLNAVLSPDWSQAAYWERGTLFVLDVATGEHRALDSIDGYLGRVADLDPVSGAVAFARDPFQFADASPDDALPLPDVDISPLAFGAVYFRDGRCLATVERGATPQDSGNITIHDAYADDDVACDAETYPISMDKPSPYISPQGTFLVYDWSDCGFPYSGSTTYVYVLDADTVTDPQPLTYVNVCGTDSVAVARDEETLYLADGFDGLRRATLAGPNIIIRDEDTLLSYDDPLTGELALIDAVVLSPDEQHVALSVAAYDESDQPMRRLVEIFALDDLRDGLLRRNVRPLLTIPGATTAMFSPTGNYVATNAGVYALGHIGKNAAVDVTIGAFSPDSRLLATYQDGFVTLWRTPQPGDTDFPLAQYEIGGVRTVSFSADGASLYVVREGEVLTWGIGK